jgi:hypothetical protein
MRGIIVALTLTALSLAACGGSSHSSGATCWYSGNGDVVQTASTFNNQSCPVPFMTASQGGPFTTDSGAPGDLGGPDCTVTFPTITWTVYATGNSGKADSLCATLESEQ